MNEPKYVDVNEDEIRSRLQTVVTDRRSIDPTIRALAAGVLLLLKAGR